MSVSVPRWLANAVWVGAAVLLAGAACRDTWRLRLPARAEVRLDTVTGLMELDSGEVAVEYIGHASFRIHSPGGMRVVIDPFASRVWLGYDFPDDVAADAILITHPHYDHDAGERMGRPFPWDSRVSVFRDPGMDRIGDVTVHGVRGKHADPYGMEFGQTNTLWVLEIAGLRIAHLGDNGPLTDANIVALGRVDILMMPIDGQYHILAAEEVEAILAALKPRVVIPMHYRLPDLETSPDSPSDLGPIDPWLADRPNVDRLDTHLRVFSVEDLLADRIVVFQHSPALRRS